MITRDITPELRQALRHLKLSPMVATLPERLRQFRESKMDAEDLLQIVFSAEVQRRQQQSTRNRANKAGLDPTMVMDAWDRAAGSPTTEHYSTGWPRCSSWPRMNTSCTRGRSASARLFWLTPWGTSHVRDGSL